MNYGEMSEAWQQEFVSWDYLSEMLPDRVVEIAKLRQDIAIAEQADDEESERKMQQRATTPMAVPPQDELDAFKAEYARPGKVSNLPDQQQIVRRPLTKKEKALHARAKRGQGASAARTEREQSASAGAYSGADTNHDSLRENGDLERKRAG